MFFILTNASFELPRPTSPILEVSPGFMSEKNRKYKRNELKFCTVVHLPRPDPPDKRRSGCGRGTDTPCDNFRLTVCRL